MFKKITSNLFMYIALILSVARIVDTVLFLSYGYSFTGLENETTAYIVGLFLAHLLWSASITAILQKKPIGLLGFSLAFYAILIMSAFEYSYSMFRFLTEFSIVTLALAMIAYGNQLTLKEAKPEAQH